MLRFPTTTPDRRIKKLQISADMFVRILLGMDGNRRVKMEGIPADARTVGLSVDEGFNTVTLYVESDEFEPCELGALYPDMGVRFSEFHGVATPDNPSPSLLESAQYFQDNADRLREEHRVLYGDPSKHPPQGMILANQKPPGMSTAATATR